LGRLLWSYASGSPCETVAALGGVGPVAEALGWFSILAEGPSR
jgi:hypothetical protein